MNLGLVGWIAGVLLTFAAIKFLVVLFKELFSKESMEAVVDKIGSSVHEGAEKAASSFKKAAKARQRKKKEMKKKEEKPLVLME